MNYQEFDDDNDDQIIEWKTEATAVLNDVKDHVKEICIASGSDSLITVDEKNEIYMNVTTLENSRYCIRMSVDGFEIVGQDYNNKSIQSNAFCYETPYALLSVISKKYIESFGNSLTMALSKLI